MTTLLKGTSFPIVRETQAFASFLETVTVSECAFSQCENKIGL